MSRFGIGVLALLLVACAGPQPGPAAPDGDTQLALAVKTRLIEDGQLAAAAIGVDAQAGRVILDGFVDSDQARQRAAELARQVSGVAVVDNQIEVK